MPTALDAHKRLLLINVLFSSSTYKKSYQTCRTLMQEREQGNRRQLKNIKKTN